MAIGGGEVSKLVTVWLTNLSQAADHESWGQPVEASDLYKKYCYIVSAQNTSASVGDAFLQAKQGNTDCCIG